MNATHTKAAVFIAIFALGFTLQAYAQGTCPRSLGDAYLDVNNVRARILNTGGLFYRGEPHVYEIPKGSGSNAIFASGIWVAGEVDGQLRAAGTRYGEWEFWAGPLDENGDPPGDCSLYDRLYKVSLADIEDYEATGAATPALRDWPTGLGAPTLAPPGNGLDDDGDGTIDEEGEQIAFDITVPLAQRAGRVINLAGGERPALIGHQSIWWVMNDRGNTHESTDVPAIGLEVHAMAFAFDAPDALGNTTFYKYNLFYKGNQPLEKAYFGIFSDPDLGDFADDYVGSDTLLGLGYVYNADNEDISGEGYGTPPPAAGYDFLQGPIVPSVGDSALVDGQRIPDFKNLAMSHFVFYNGGGCVICEPITGQDYYNYMQGRWKDGQRVTFGGNGRDFSQIPVNYMFPGDPATGEGWSEVNPAGDGSLPPIDPADRRLVMSSGPFTINPGDLQQVVFGIVWAIGNDNFDSVTQLKEADAQIQDAFNNGFADAPPPTSPPTQPVILASPGDRASGQPTNPTLYWNPLLDLLLYRVEVSTDEAFSSNVNQYDLLATSLDLSGLAENTTHFWRVRARTAGGIGPWSEVWRFSTSDVVLTDDAFITGFATTANRAGSINPWDMAAFAFNNSGFPRLEGTLTPVGSYPNGDHPTRNVQQANSNAAWGIHTGGNGRTSFETWLNRTFTARGRTILGSLGGNDFEWRFTQRCLDEPPSCIGWRRFEDDLPMQIPFELWNVGPTDDPSDDYRMIPAILDTCTAEESCENWVTGGTAELDVFDISGDHDISDSDDDPYTDWVYWFDPVDTSPGEAGYQAFAVAPANGSPALGAEVMARTVLVNWNGWQDTDGDGTFDAVTAPLPEPGTVFRIVTGPVQPPLLAAPADGSADQPTTLTFYWNALDGSSFYQLEIATDSTFTTIVGGALGLTDQFHSFDDLDANATFFWHVRLVNLNAEPISSWSDTWQFSTGAGGPVAVEALDGGIPETYALGTNYPNPFNPTTQIEFGLPEATRVQLEIYDVLGRRVARLVEDHLPAGYHRATWEAHDKASGVYLYRLTASSFSQTRVMVLVR